MERTSEYHGQQRQKKKKNVKRLNLKKGKLVRQNQDILNQDNLVT